MTWNWSATALDSFTMPPAVEDGDVVGCESAALQYSTSEFITLSPVGGGTPTTFRWPRHLNKILEHLNYVCACQLNFSVSVPVSIHELPDLGGTGACFDGREMPSLYCKFYDSTGNILFDYPKIFSVTGDRWVTNITSEASVATLPEVINNIRVRCNKFEYPFDYAPYHARDYISLTSDPGDWTWRTRILVQGLEEIYDACPTYSATPTSNPTEDYAWLNDSVHCLWYLWQNPTNQYGYNQYLSLRWSPPTAPWDNPAPTTNEADYTYGPGPDPDRWIRRGSPFFNYSDKYGLEMYDQIYFVEERAVEELWGAGTSDNFTREINGWKFRVNQSGIPIYKFEALDFDSFPPSENDYIFTVSLIHDPLEIPSVVTSRGTTEPNTTWSSNFTSVGCYGNMQPLSIKFGYVTGSWSTLTYGDIKPNFTVLTEFTACSLVNFVITLNDISDFLSDGKLNFAWYQVRDGTLATQPNYWIDAPNADYAFHMPGMFWPTLATPAQNIEVRSNYIARVHYDTFRWYSFDADLSVTAKP